MSTATVHRYLHVVPEQQKLLRHIKARHNTVRMLMRRSGLPERRVQRRVTEMLAQGWIEQVGTYTESSVSLRIFGLTEEGLRNVPSGR